MRARAFLSCLVMVATLATLFSWSARASDEAWAQFARGELVLLLRHALAPGNGDPANFELRDCSTQRNLNDTGRDDSRAIGRELTRRGVAEARIWSSQWCRCLETARLLGLGEVAELPGLNSFYEQTELREPNLAAMREFFLNLKPGQPPVILVTHFVTVSALTGVGVGSGEGVLARVGADGSLTTELVVTFE